MTDLKQIVELGKRASPRPWVPWHEEATGSNGWADKAMIAGLPLTSIDRMTAFWKQDAAYLAAAANSADIMAQQLLDIEKLRDDFNNITNDSVNFAVFRGRLNEILGRGKG